MNLLALVGPSGVGKSTLKTRLMLEFPNVRESISSTTRAPRPGETHGKSYYFVNRTEFEADIKANRFLEWVELHGNYYGTQTERVDSLTSTGHHVVFDIDVRGALSIGNQRTLHTIFIQPPSFSVLEERLRARNTETPEQIQKRLNWAKGELAQAEKFSHQIINDDLEKAYTELLTLWKPLITSSRK